MAHVSKIPCHCTRLGQRENRDGHHDLAFAVRKSWKSTTAFRLNWGIHRRNGVPCVNEVLVVVQHDNALWAVKRSGSPSTAAAPPIWQRSAWVFRDPIAQFQVFPYFAAFVAVFFRFAWPVIDLAEGVFGVANYVRYYFEGFNHGLHPLLCILQTASSEKSANPPGEFPCCRFDAAIAVSEVTST